MSPGARRRLVAGGYRRRPRQIYGLVNWMRARGPAPTPVRAGKRASGRPGRGGRRHPKELAAGPMGRSRGAGAHLGARAGANKTLGPSWGISREPMDAGAQTHTHTRRAPLIGRARMIDCAPLAWARQRRPDYGRPMIDCSLGSIVIPAAALFLRRRAPRCARRRPPPDPPFSGRRARPNKWRNWRLAPADRRAPARRKRHRPGRPADRAPDGRPPVLVGRQAWGAGTRKLINVNSAPGATVGGPARRPCIRACIRRA